MIARVETHLALRRQALEIAEQHRSLKQSLERLRALERQREELSQMLMHDLRSPLAGILICASHLEVQAAKEGAGETVEIAKSIHVAARVLGDMVSDILDISRIEAESMPLDLQQAELGAIVDRAKETLGALVSTNRLWFDRPPYKVLAVCDPGVTARILHNLFDNGLKYCGSHGSVTIRIESGEGVAHVLVSDNGPGIPEALHEQIFEKFQYGQGGQCQRRSTGLGLYFCKLATEAQGGTIRVDSKPGRGSTFCVTLPAATSASGGAPIQA